MARLAFMRSLLFGLTLLAVASAMTASAIYLRNEQIRVLQDPPEAILVYPTPVDSETRQAVEINLLWSNPLTIASPHWTGIVTAVNVTSGSVVPSGIDPIEVDGSPRPWFPAAKPLYRSIGRSMIGPDVDAVGDFLVDRGFLEGPIETGEPVGTDYQDAIRAYGVEAGLLPAGTRRTQAAFQPTWVVWLPESTNGRVDHVEPGVGSQATPGSTLVTLVPDLLEASVSSEDLIMSSGSLPIELSPILSIEIGNQRFATNDGHVLETELDGLEALLAPGIDGVPGKLVLTYPGALSALPVSSVIRDSTGETCVATVVGHTRIFRRIDIVGGDLAVVVVTQVESGENVLANPIDLGVTSCSLVAASQS